jgi:hypothetical protein
MPRTRAIRTLGALNALPLRSRRTWERALDALYLMRTHGLSLASASRAVGATPRGILTYIGPALKRTPNGRYAAKPRDGLLRMMRLLSPRGEIEIAVTDSRTASTLAEYANAVRHYLTTGDRSLLKPFRGRIISAQKVAYKLETDPRVLDRLGDAGALSFDDLYVRV